MTDTQIDNLIAAAPEALKEALGDVRDDIKAAASDAEERAENKDRASAWFAISLNLRVQVHLDEKAPNAEIDATVTRKGKTTVQLNLEPTAELEPGFGKSEKPPKKKSA